MAINPLWTKLSGSKIALNCRIRMESLREYCYYFKFLSCLKLNIIIF